MKSPCVSVSTAPTALGDFRSDPFRPHRYMQRTGGQIAAVNVKFPHRGNLIFAEAPLSRLSRSNVAMSGDDDAVRNGGVSAKGTQGTRRAYIWRRANGRCRATQWSDREFDAACKSISRPALALSRR